MLSAGNRIVVPTDAAASPLGNVEWFLDRLDFPNQLAIFTRTDRATLSEAPFLDHRWRRRGSEQRALPLARLREFQTYAPAPAFIWRSAFCCSTLIASCLDAPGICLALNEPAALVDLGSARKSGAPDADSALASAVFARLGVGFGPGERVVIKPSSAAYTLLPEAVQSEAPILLLYSGCRDFLLSVIGGGRERGGGEHRRKLVRDLMAARVLSGQPGLRFRPEDLCVMTDLQAAALLWHVQVAEFRAVAKAAGPAQARSLDCEIFLADPARNLGAIDDFLGLGLGGGLGRYAAAPEMAFNAEARRRGFLELEEQWGSQVDALVAWSYEIFSETPKGDPIGAPLLALDA